MKNSLSMTKRIVIIIAFVLLLIGTIVYITHRSKADDTFSEYEVQINVEASYSEETKYEPYINGYIHYDRDGAEAVGSKGELLWNVSYNIKKPSAVVNGKYAMVADIGGNEAYIFDESGEKKRVSAADSIQEIDISANGIAAIRIKNKTTDGISIIGADGTKYVDIITNEQKDGFPVDITLAKDGTRLAAMYFVIEDGIMKSQFSFYNFSRVGQNYVDRLVGLFKDDRLAIASEFIGEDHFAVFFEDGIKIYSFKELPEELLEIKEDSIKDIFFDENYIGLITKGNKKPYRIKLYNINGKNVFDEETELEYTALEMLKGEIVLYNEKSLQVWELTGKLRYEGEYEDKIELIIPIGNFEYVILADEKMKNIRLINAKE